MRSQTSGRSSAPERLGLNLDSAALELATDLGRDVAGVDLDGRGPQLVDPGGDAKSRTPLRHQRESRLGRPADRLEHLRSVVDNDLVLHLGRDHLAGKQGWINFLAVEIEVHSAACQREPFGQREDSRAGESAGELRAGIKGPELGEGSVAYPPATVCLVVELLVMEEDVLTILGEPDVDFDPFERVGDRQLDRPRRVFRRLPHRSAMGHDLQGAGRSDRLEEREASGILRGTDARGLNQNR